MLIQKLRLKRGWSQQQLADASGLSARTIQRLEAGMPASTESLKSLAAVFEINFGDLDQEQNAMNASTVENKIPHRQEEAAFRHVRRLRGLYMHLFQLLPVALVLLAVNYWVYPRHLWAVWVIVIMALGFAIHAAYVFGAKWMLGPQWELKQVEKYLGRPLE